MIIDHTGKTVIITGGALGIGRGVVLEFAKAGANIAIIDIDKAAATETMQLASRNGSEVIFIRADLGLTEDCERAVNHTVEQLGKIDILINNVGIQHLESYQNVENTSEELWDRILNVNLKSYFLMTKLSIPQMRKRGGGTIINVASVQGLQSMPLVPAYAASKGAILSLTRQVALDYAKENIRVVAINPGTIYTPLVEAAAQATKNPKESIRQWTANQPLGRLGKPEDIAKAMVFLASTQAGFITGENLNVDGGIMAIGAWSAPVPEW